MNRAEWIEQSKCRDYPVTGNDDPWHPEGTGAPARASQRIALDICNGTSDRPGCPVKAQCLADALQDEEHYGIRGGLTAPQRTRLKNGQQTTRPLSPCGTRSAYQRHLRNSEPLDQPCIEAEAAYAAALRQRRQQRKAVSA